VQRHLPLPAAGLAGALVLGEARQLALLLAGVALALLVLVVAVLMVLLLLQHCHCQEMSHCWCGQACRPAAPRCCRADASCAALQRCLLPALLVELIMAAAAQPCLACLHLLFLPAALLGG
jgi:hypothetical protein